MSGIAEIENAIQKLPPAQVEELAVWLEKLRAERTARPDFEAWLARARGAPLPGVTTESVMAMTRGED